MDIQALIESMTEAPRYKTGKRAKRKVTAAVMDRIHDFLQENADKRRRGQRKQQKTMMDMYEALEAEGMSISYSTVRRLVRAFVDKPKEAFIREIYAPGDVCEFDWGEVKITVNGTLQSFQMAVFTAAYSNYRYACLFPKQATECFQEAHARFFAHINGVYSTMVYDNMKVAVKRLVGSEKEPTEGLMALELHYGFRSRFCNVRRGNEKGHVERSVDVIRRKAFAFQDTFESLEEANRYLLAVCVQLNAKQTAHLGSQTPVHYLEAERSHLLSAPPKWEAARVSYNRVDKYATVIIDQNRYSVPDHLVGKLVMVKVYAEQIRCFYEEDIVAQHLRLCGHHQWRLELDHVLPTLQKKPAALAGSMALQQANNKIKTIYHHYYIGKEKDFLALLQFISEGGALADVLRSIDELHRMNPKHVTTDKIKVLCATYRDIVPATSTTHSTTTREIVEQSRAHARAYDQLFQLTAKEVVH